MFHFLTPLIEANYATYTRLQSSINIEEHRGRNEGWQEPETGHSHSAGRSAES